LFKSKKAANKKSRHEGGFSKLLISASD